MRLIDLAALARTEPALASIAGQKSALISIPESARPLILAALAHSTSRHPIVIAAPTGTAAREIFADMSNFVSPHDIVLFPAWETLPFERVSPSIDTMGKRMEVLWRLRDSSRSPRFVITGVRALLQKLAPHANNVDPIVVRKSDTYNIDSLCERLVHDGYRRETLVEHRGEFSRRGAIVDVFPSTMDEPVRIDMWGDEVDRLTHFTVNDQRSTDDIEHVEIFPARELLLTPDVRATAATLVGTEPWGREQWERLSEGQTFDGMESWLPWLVTEQTLLTDFLSDDALMVMIEPRRMIDRARDLLAEEDDLAKALATSWARDATVQFPRLHTEPERLLSEAQRFPTINVTTTPESPTSPSVSASGWSPIVQNPEPIVRRIAELLADKWCVIVLAETLSTVDRLVGLMREHGLEFQTATEVTDLTKPGAYVVHAVMGRGVSLPHLKLALITESDLTGRRRGRRQHESKSSKKRGTVTVFEDLQPGGYVVHQHHGVGRYEGMVTRSIGGVERDYLLLAYKGGDKLYVPTDQIGTVRQYIGGETPTPHRLGGTDFAKAKSRVRSAVRAVAQELVVLYQRRVTTKGHAFAPDTPWQSEMESAFPFVETPDQLTAISNIKTDMEQDIPMDRLLCGDVGFGKTEVAIRAAFKAIQDGKQVAVLVPTTLLATQHGTTFSDRFAGYPIRVEVLSRFLTNAMAKKVIAGLKTGEIDCVIGTHRLLQEGISFKDLGLLIVDEEQRFGVQHKEAMKRMRTDVDVLTMSATPIPRTLEMSLVGIRDLSLLQTPPADRQPILTYVSEDNERVAVEALRRELLREGQVFWVHNRVKTIQERAAELRELVPEARIAVAHGQMDEGTLEQVVLDFWNHEYDVLVCTTIIESGIDMPTVNTLVIERADLLGLGQLHQLRGRAGRSGQRAYAYLFHPQDQVLSEDAYERLRTIGEATDLGSGFKIAMRDLEIRGAGNLLGEAQSGHIAAVGYDLYCQMVTEAVAEMKGEVVQPRYELKLDVPVDAHLPHDYVPSEELRLEAYRRLADVTTILEVNDIEQEWIDRFGPLPAPAARLLQVATLRAECHRCEFTELVATGREIRISPVQLRASQMMTLKRIASGANYREAQKQLLMPLPHKTDVTQYLISLINELFEPADH